MRKFYTMSSHGLNTRCQLIRQGLGIIGCPSLKRMPNHDNILSNITQIRKFYLGIWHHFPYLEMKKEFRSLMTWTRRLLSEQPYWYQILLFCFVSFFEVYGFMSSPTFTFLCLICNNYPCDINAMLSSLCHHFVYTCWKKFI